MSFPSDTKIRYVGVAPILYKQAQTWLNGRKEKDDPWQTV